MALDSIPPIGVRPFAFDAAPRSDNGFVARQLPNAPVHLAQAAAGGFRVTPVEPDELPDEPPPQGFTRAAVMDTLSRILSRATPALDPERMAAAALGSIQGLAALDPELGAERDGNVIYLTKGNQELGSFRVPANVGEWARAAETTARAFGAASGTVAAAGDAELTDAFYRGLAAPLEGNARYRASSEPPPTLELATDGRVMARIVDGVGVLRVPNVSVLSGLAVRDALADWGLLGGGPAKVVSLVIDLTDAMGTENNAAAIIADDLLRRGVIYRTRGSDPGRDQRILADAAGIPADVPVVVLVNGATRGAAETLAQALQENHRAVIYGTSTMGDNRDFSRVMVPGGGRLDFSTANVLGPAGFSSQGQGVTPQACASATGEEPSREARTTARRAGQNDTRLTIPLRRFCPPSPNRAVVATPAFIGTDEANREAWTLNAVALARDSGRYRSLLERVEPVQQPAPRSPWLFDRPGRS